MDWTNIDVLLATAPPPAGYRFALLTRPETGALIASIKAWFPDISVGGASCYTREDFYAQRVHFVGESEKDVLVVQIKQGAELVGLFSCERDLDTLALYARLAVIAPAHRGAYLAHASCELRAARWRRRSHGASAWSWSMAWRR